MRPVWDRQHRLLERGGEDVPVPVLYLEGKAMVTNRKKVDVPRRNENAHANCNRKPCPYCAALNKTLREFEGGDYSDTERFERGLPRGPYQG